MKKSEIVDLVIEEFVKDKELIKQNMIQAMDTIVMEKKCDGYKFTLICKYEREVENESK